MKKNLATGIPLALSLIFITVILMSVWWQVVFSRMLNAYVRAELLELEQQIFRSQTTSPDALDSLLKERKIVYVNECTLFPCLDSITGQDNKIQISPEYHNRIRNYRRRQLNMIFSEMVFLIAVLGTASFYMIYLLTREKKIHDEREEFLAMATHELKHPLARISLVLESLKRKTLPPEREHSFIEQGISEIQLMKTQLENLLKIQELDILTRREETPYAVQPFLEHVIEYMRSTRADATDRIVFSSQLSPLVEASCSCNRQGLQTILSNLIKNALIYSHDTVTVRVKNVKKNIAIEIEDKGIGFMPEEIQRMGSMFYRSPRHQVQNTKGTGLGLFTVYRLVGLLGLKIDLESAGENQGSMFRLTLK